MRFRWFGNLLAIIVLFCVFGNQVLARKNINFYKERTEFTFGGLFGSFGISNRQLIVQNPSSRFSKEIFRLETGETGLAYFPLQNNGIQFGWANNGFIGFITFERQSFGYTNQTGFELNPQTGLLSGTRQAIGTVISVYQFAGIGFGYFRSSNRFSPYLVGQVFAGDRVEENAHFNFGISKLKEIGFKLVTGVSVRPTEKGMIFRACPTFSYLLNKEFGSEASMRFYNLGFEIGMICPIFFNL